MVMQNPSTTAQQSYTWAKWFAVLDVTSFVVLQLAKTRTVAALRPKIHFIQQHCNLSISVTSDILCLALLSPPRDLKSITLPARQYSQTTLLLGSITCHGRGSANHDGEPGNEEDFDRERGRQGRWINTLNSLVQEPANAYTAHTFHTILTAVWDHSTAYRSSTQNTHTHNYTLETHRQIDM